ncbi:MAG TPA: M56 family metallopeptidase, partial [Bryobacteraceae bacterium]|nr:M56 family metallopeptidase [Bryobacteraceae bacterium]
MSSLFGSRDALPFHPFTRLMTERIGWTLVHFLWQGLLIAILYALARGWLAKGCFAKGKPSRPATPQTRYVLACSALIVMLAAPVVTFSVLQSHHPSPASTSYVGVPTAPMAQPGVAGPSALSRLRPTQTAMPVPAVPANGLLTWFVLFWLAGVLLYSLRLIIGCFAAARLRFRSVRLAPPEWQQKFSELGTKIRVCRPVRLMVSAWAEAPAVVGWLRPVVLLPVGMLTGLPPDQIEALLLHELAHVRRHDYLVNILQSVIEGLLFYHPAVWWISGHIRAEREACCDDLAVSASGDVLAYVRALTELALLRPLRLAPAVAASGGSLANRIARLLGTARPTTGPRPPMVGAIVGALLLVVTGFGVFAQTTGPRAPLNASGVNTPGQTFEAADVHASPRAANPYTYSSGGVLRGGRYDLRKATMLDLIKTAWNVDPDIIVGGPNWLALDRFDVSAKAPPQTPPETIRLMLQALLRDRFGLVIHKDTRSMQAYALTVGRNKPKLTESNRSGPAGCEYQQPPAPSTLRLFACRAITMDAFAQRLRQMAGDYLAAPVVNETGLEGAWDFDLKWNPRAQIL